MIEDPKLMKELREHANDLKAAHAERDNMFQQYTDMYLLDWRKKASRRLKNKQITASPDFRNQVQGAVRLMVATQPQINVVRNTKSEGAAIEGIEGFLNEVLHQSGRLAGEPVHYPLITAGLLYDEMHAAITPTADLVEYAKATEPADERARLYHRATIERLEEIADTTAFLVEAWHPTTGYPEFTSTGLTAYYRAIETTVGEVIDRYGHNEKLAVLPRHTKTNLHIFFDPVYTAVWTDQAELLLKPHGLARIPVVAQILNGSRLFSKPEDQRQPFGYTLLKSGLWNAQNLSLTAIFTAVFNYGVTPQKVYTPQIEGSQIEINEDDDVINLHPGDRLDFVQNKGAIDPSLWQASELSGSLGDESTIYPQALGAAVSGSSTYSELALLSQAGRLPLVGPQRRGGWGISDVCETILALMRGDPRYRAKTKLTAADVARGIQVDVKLDVQLPQDKLQQANIVNILAGGEDPKVPLEWALENVLNINNAGEMRRQIWKERAREQLYQVVMQDLIQKFAASQQQPPQPGAPGVPGAGGPPMQPPQPGPGAPPMGEDMMQAGPMMTPGQGEMMQGGLPPQMGGMMPGAGAIMQPPEEQPEV